jgi:acetyltransferase-like isoleucine patch superfamily enzyme
MSPQTQEAKSTGAFRHPLSLVETDAVGDGTQISAFAHILPGARIGRDCRILDHTVVGDNVVVGDRVTVSAGVHLADAELEDDVFLGANVAIARGPESTGSQRTVVRSGASIGANATLAAGVIISESAVVSPGALVTRNVPANAIIAGNPAQIVGYVGTAPANRSSVAAQPGAEPCNVAGVVFRRLPRFEDMRGALTVAEFQAHVPFPIQRLFLVYDVPNREIRGEHAHYTLHQFLICVRGSCAVLVDDGAHRHEFRLETPCDSLYVPPMTWSVQYKHSPDAVLLVLASAPYDAADYIREYSTFVKAVRGRA